MIVRLAKMNTDKFVEGVIGIGIVIYILRYFLAPAVMGAANDTNLSGYAALLGLVIIFIILALVYAGWSLFKEGRSR